MHAPEARRQQRGIVPCLRDSTLYWHLWFLTSGPQSCERINSPVFESTAVCCEVSPGKLTQGQPRILGLWHRPSAEKAHRRLSCNPASPPASPPHLWEIRQTLLPWHISPWWALSWWSVYSSFSPDQTCLESEKHTFLFPYAPVPLLLFIRLLQGRQTV